VVYAAVLRLDKEGKIRVGGCGVYPGWTHLDVRPRAEGARLALWKGACFGSEIA